MYEACLVHELRKRGLEVNTQVPVPLVYNGVRFEEALRLDVLVSGLVIVEVKAVEATTAVHRAQLRTYLRLTGLNLGFVINFNVTGIRDGIRRVIIRPVEAA